MVADDGGLAALVEEADATQASVEMDGFMVATAPLTDEENKVYVRFASGELYGRQLTKSDGKENKAKQDAQTASRRVVANHIAAKVPDAEPKSAATTFKLAKNLHDDIPSFVCVKRVTDKTLPLSVDVISEAVDGISEDDVYGRVKGPVNKKKVGKAFITAVKKALQAVRITHRWDVEWAQSADELPFEDTDDVVAADDELQRLCNLWWASHKEWKSSAVALKTSRVKVKDKFGGFNKAVEDDMKARNITSNRLEMMDPSTKKAVTVWVRLVTPKPTDGKLSVKFVDEQLGTVFEEFGNATTFKTEDGRTKFLATCKAALVANAESVLAEKIQRAPKLTIHVNRGEKEEVETEDSVV